MLVSEFVQKAAPERSKYYRLRLKFSDGTSREYPASPEGYLVGQAPVGTPPGSYEACYYDEAHQPLTLPAPVLVELSLESARVGTAQMGLSLSNASGAPRTSGPAAAPAQARFASEPPGTVRPTVPAGPATSSLSPEAEWELRRIHHALEVEERQQEFIKNSTYVTEVAELFELNRVMRREMVEMQRVIVQQAQQGHKDLDLMKSTLRDLFKLQQEALDKAAALIPSPPPPPPPDYVGLGHTALGVLREIGVALIDSQHRRSGEPAGKLRSASKLSQLPAAELERAALAKDATDEPPSSKDAPPAAFLERLLHKLKGVSELDLALAMSSPSSWKAFLDDVLAAPRPSAEAEKPAESAEKTEERV